MIPTKNDDETKNNFSLLFFVKRVVLCSLKKTPSQKPRTCTPHNKITPKHTTVKFFLDEQQQRQKRREILREEARKFNCPQTKKKRERERSY